MAQHGRVTGITFNSTTGETVMSLVDDKGRTRKIPLTGEAKASFLKGVLQHGGDEAAASAVYTGKEAVYEIVRVGRGFISSAIERIGFPDIGKEKPRLP